MTARLSQRASSDLRATFAENRIWRALAFADVRSRYRFSKLGTLWITMSTGIMAVSIGLIYGQFFGQQISTYLPYLTSGMVIWTFIASALNESTHALIQSGAWIKGSRLPLTFYVMRMLHKNFIVLLHNIIIVALVWLFIRWDVGPGALLAVPGIVIIYVTTAAWSVVIAFACVRYRDIPPMIAAGTQFLFFATPIIWHADQLKLGQWLLTVNPLAYLLPLARDPLLGRGVPVATWLFAIVIMAVSIAAAGWVYRRYRHRVAYWV